MDLKAALRWAAFYRLVSWAFGVVFLLFLGVAYLLGLWEVVIAVLNRQPRLYNPWFVLPPVLVALVGLLVWQFGTTVAWYKSTTEAVDQQMAERFDAQRVKSEILEVLDDRLAEMQTEMQRTRKQVEDTTTATSGGSESGFEFEE